MPQARTRGAQLQQLDAALAEFKKQAKDIDGLMEVMGKVAEVLIETFKVIATAASTTPKFSSSCTKAQYPASRLPAAEMAEAVARAARSHHPGIYAAFGIPPKLLLELTNSHR